MGYNTSTIGGGGASPVANQWANILGQGLSSGQYSNAPNSGQGPPSSWMGPGGMRFNGPTYNPGGSPNPTGGLGMPGADPRGATAQTGGLTGYMNNQLNANPSQLTYSNPNNPAPQGYNPTQVNFGYTPTNIAGGYTPTPIDQHQAMNFGFNPIANPGASGLYNQAQSGQMNMAQALGQYGQGGSPFAGASMPGSPGVGDFNSPGILGDRSNVVSAIINAAHLQNSQALADQNARFTTMGGMSGGTPAAYATAQTLSQGDTALANALAQADINYRNLDLGAYQSQNQTNAANFGTMGQMYGAQLGRLGTYGNTALAGLTGAAGAYQQVAGNEAAQQGLGYNYNSLGQSGNLATNQMNLNSGLGFSELNQAGQQYNNTNAYNAAGQNIQSGIANNNNMYNAGMGNMQAQQYNNANAYNAGNQAWQGYGMQGGLDQNAQGMGYNQQQNLINQLFGQYGNMFNVGTPQAATSVTPNAGMNILNAIPGVMSGVSGLRNAFNGGGGGGQQQQFNPAGFGQGFNPYQYGMPTQIPGISGFQGNPYMNGWGW